jgi:hypothetical protein
MTELTFARVLEVADLQLKYAIKMFKRNPSSTYWHVLTREMLVYQQLHFVNPAQKAALVAELNVICIGNWPDAILKNLHGVTVAEALEYPA